MKQVKKWMYSILQKIGYIDKSIPSTLNFVLVKANKNQIKSNTTTDYSNILFVLVCTITYIGFCLAYLPKSMQYIAKYNNNMQNLQSIQFGLEKPYPKIQSGNKLSKAK